jgi:hypothetical protein
LAAKGVEESRVSAPSTHALIGGTWRPAEADLKELQSPARRAIRQAAARLRRAAEADDVEGIIGASKELVETVAKCVIDAFGDTYGSDAKVHSLAGQAIDVLEGPAGLQGRASLKRLGGGLVSVVVGIAELRNSDGTGHGRAWPSDVDPSASRLAQESAQAWTDWILAVAGNSLRHREAIELAVEEVAGARVFHRDELPAFLEALSIEDLDERYQQRLGLAVARRWSVGGTFLAFEDVIEPVASDQMTFPEAFTTGLLEGLLLDQDGYLRTTPKSLRALIAIANRLESETATRVLTDLADKADEAQLSYAFDYADVIEAINMLNAYAMGLEDAATIAVARIGGRLNTLLEEELPNEEGDEVI